MRFESKITKVATVVKVRVYMLCMILLGMVSNVSVSFAATPKPTKKPDLTGSGGTGNADAGSVEETLENFVNYGTAILIGLGALALIVLVAVPWITGGEEGAQKAKKNLKGVVIGIVIGTIALSLAQTIKGFVV